MFFWIFVSILHNHINQDYAYQPPIDVSCIVSIYIKDKWSILGEKLKCRCYPDSYFGQSLRSFFVHLDQIEALFSFRHQVEYCSLPCSTPGILKVCLASVNLLDQFVELCRGVSILMHETLR